MQISSQSHIFELSTISNRFVWVIKWWLNLHFKGELSLQGELWTEIHIMTLNTIISLTCDAARLQVNFFLLFLKGSCNAKHLESLLISVHTVNVSSSSHICTQHTQNTKAEWVWGFPVIIKTTNQMQLQSEDTNTFINHTWSPFYLTFQFSHFLWLNLQYLPSFAGLLLEVTALTIRGTSVHVLEPSQCARHVTPLPAEEKYRIRHTENQHRYSLDEGSCYLCVEARLNGMLWRHRIPERRPNLRKEKHQRVFNTLVNRSRANTYCPLVWSPQTPAAGCTGAV